MNRTLRILLIGQAGPHRSAALRRAVALATAGGLIQFSQQRQVDVVVMDRAQRAIAGKWLGSTTESVLYRLSGSILAIRSGGG